MGDETSEPKETRYLAVLLVILFVLLTIGFGLPVYQEFKAYRHQAQLNVIRRTKNNLKQFGLAFHNYHATYQSLPASALRDDSGQPAHSWLALILPFVDENFLFKQIDFHQPWDSPQNQPAFQQRVSCYLNPKLDQTKSLDGYALSHFAGNELVLKQGTRRTFDEIQDGLSNTIIALERADDFKPWGDPDSLARPIDLIGPGKKTNFDKGSFVLFADGSVRFVDPNIDPKTLKALSTPNGGETIGDF